MGLCCSITNNVDNMQDGEDDLNDMIPHYDLYNYDSYDAGIEKKKSWWKKKRR